MSIAETVNLTKSYGRNRGIIDVNINVNEGEIFGFIGPNGAGKSTFIRTILNFTFPTSGYGKIYEKDIVKDSESIKEIVGYVPSEVKYYSKVTVKNILEYSKSFKKSSSNKQIEDLVKELDIDINKTMSELSLGNKKKIAIAQALIGDPKFLILDEPTSGLDPLMQKKLFDILKRFKKEGKTVFLSSHNLVEVENLCDRVAIIREGSIVDTIELQSALNGFGKVIEVEGNIPKKYMYEIANNILSVDQNRYKFIYKGDINLLIKSLSKYDINDLSIRKENIEDTFIKYYQEKDGE